MINLTIEEKNDLNEVHDCLLVNNRFDFILIFIHTIIDKARFLWLKSSPLQLSKTARSRTFQEKSA